MKATLRRQSLYLDILCNTWLCFLSYSVSPSTPHTCACVCACKPLCGLLNLFVIIARILITGLSYDLILEPFLEVWLNGLSSKVLSNSFLAYFNVLRSLQPLLSSYNNFSLCFFCSVYLFILWHICATSQVWSCGRELVLFLPTLYFLEIKPTAKCLYPHWVISPTPFSYVNKDDIYQFLLNCGPWCHMPFWRENHEIKACLGYTVKPCLKTEKN